MKSNKWATPTFDFFLKLALTVLTSPWRRKWQPTPVFLPGESYGWRNLVGYSPRGHRVGHDWSDLAYTYRSQMTSYHFPVSWWPKEVSRKKGWGEGWSRIDARHLGPKDTHLRFVSALSVRVRECPLESREKCDWLSGTRPAAERGEGIDREDVGSLGPRGSESCVGILFLGLTQRISRTTLWKLDSQL